MSVRELVAGLSELNVNSESSDDSKRDAVKVAFDALQAAPVNVTSLLGLGRALIGVREYATAYKVLSKACSLAQPCPPRDLLKWLGEAMLGLGSGSWLKESGVFAKNFSRDALRDPSSVRVFAASDLHVDQGNLDWCKNISPTGFQNDVLIVAGDVADTLSATRAALALLRPKFGRVFWVPGNHEMWLTGQAEQRVFPDSVCKLIDLVETLDALDVDVRPAEVARGLFVVPLASWYEASFDKEDPKEGLYRYDKFVKFPLRDEQVGRFMLDMNHPWLELDMKKRPTDTVITFSHFLPRPELPSSPYVAELRKNVGCLGLDDQIEALQSSIHIFGHTHISGRWDLERPKTQQAQAVAAAAALLPLGASHSARAAGSTGTGTASSSGAGGAALGVSSGNGGGGGNGPGGGKGVAGGGSRPYVQYAVDGEGGAYAGLCMVYDGSRPQEVRVTMEVVDKGGGEGAGRGRREGRQSEEGVRPGGFAL